ncbi:Myo20 [Bugula neritina]|uniref:Myo20 n=2 Tax=Bugula neritina TaxID=10212 RepID=A0A7J7J0U0_BUGNE|nr:Myo20 [Bugula neritina]
MPDEMVALFGKKGVTSSLLSKLYSRELKDLEANGGKAKGYSYCAVPCPSIGYNMQPGCYGQDFLYSLDCLMQTLAFSNTTFVRCIKASESGTPHLWDAEYVHRQVVMLEVLETTKLLTSGLPHKLSYKDFVHKYQCISKLRLRPPSWTLEHYREFTQDIIDQYLQELESKSIPYQTSSWVFGKKHIFLSDDFSRQLDMLLNDVRVKSACKIQAAFRGWLIRDSWQGIIEHRRAHRRGGKGKVPQAYDSGYNTPLSHRLPHPKPPTSQPIDNYNLYSKNTDHLFHWKPTFKNMQDMGTPPLPDKRKYSISRGMKVYFPQVRVMKENINVEGYELKENSEVLCVGYSSRPSHVSIAFQNDILEVPFEKTSIRITNQLHGPELQKL